MSEQVTFNTHPRFTILKPVIHSARTGPQYQQVCPPNLEEHLLSALRSKYIAIDFETKGNDYSLPFDQAHIVGVGLAWEEGSCYFDIFNLSEKEYELFTSLLQTHKGLLAHNVYFDGGWIRRDFGFHPDWAACTYALYMQLASEGFEGQRWGLKDAMVDLLGWEKSNEGELDEWLIANDYKTKNGKPLKGEMWRAPPSILGKYCVLDAEATYLLFTEVLKLASHSFPQMMEYHQKDFLSHVKVHIDQKIYGILTDRNHWERYAEELSAAIAGSEANFRNHTKVAPLIAEWEEAKLNEFLATEPDRYKKVKERKEPEQFTKSGATSKNWIKWSQLSKLPPPISKNWESWEAKRKKILAGELPEYQFNIQSGDHLRWLLYTKLGNKVNLTTETGLPAIGEDALQGMGEIGNLLIQRSLKVKELSYLSDYLSKTKNRDTIHPSFKMPGTVTGRLAGKEPNLQQVPKTRGVLSGFISRPGHSFVDCDVNALEMVVTAELSQDKNLLSLYGPDATWPTVSTKDLISMLELQGIRYRVLENGDIEVCDEDM